MKFWANFLKAIGYLWLLTGGLIILIGMVGVWITDGFAAIPRWLSPFDAVNWVMMMVAVVPGLGLLMLAAKLREEVSGNDSLVQAYGALLEETIDVLVADENGLPAPKHELKSALLEALGTTRNPERRVFLQNAYMDLAMFQPGVGEEPIRFESSPSAAAKGYKAIIAAAGTVTARNPKMGHWSGVMAKESRQLLQELQSAGFGSDAIARRKGVN